VVNSILPGVNTADAINPPPVGYDLIGDVHGDLEALMKLLLRLGYRPESGFWRHAERQAVFIGDLIDRGPNSRGVVRLVRSMVEAGAAACIMGNHEFNAIAYSTADRERPGQYLRPHSPSKTAQHMECLRSYAGHEAQLESDLAWFKSLPPFLDLGGLIAVHAAWGPQMAESLAEAPWDYQRLKDAVTDGHPLKIAKERLFNGPEVPLPTGRLVHDKAGEPRTEARIRWWGAAAATWRDWIFPAPPASEGWLDEQPTAESVYLHPAGAVPVIFGHYSLPADAPAVLAPNIACIDFGCGKTGALGAYRWDGEPELCENKVVRVGLSFGQCNTQELLFELLAAKGAS
jgi:hypothetical protein